MKWNGVEGSQSKRAVLVVHADDATLTVLCLQMAAASGMPVCHELMAVSSTADRS